MLLQLTAIERQNKPNTQLGLVGLVEGKLVAEGFGPVYNLLPNFTVQMLAQDKLQVQETRRKGQGTYLQFVGIQQEFSETSLPLRQPKFSLCRTTH